MKKWKTIKSEQVLDEWGAKVRRDWVELSNGKVLDDYYVYEISEWSCVVPFTPDGQVVLVEQYRHALGDFTLEFPSGMMEEFETPEQCAERELLEETGYAAKRFESLGSFHLSPSKIVNRFHLMAAFDCELRQEQNLDEVEEIRVITMPIDEFDRLVQDGKIQNVDAALAWFYCKQKGMI